MTTPALRTPLVGGNWKMNCDLAAAKALASGVAGGFAAKDELKAVQVVIFPPFPYLLACSGALKDAGGHVMLGGQDVYPAGNGAFTGEISPPMLIDCGCSWVLCGHSERRHVLHEGDDLINAKVRTSLAAGLQVTLCVGEKLEQRITGQTDTVNERQVERGLRGVTAEELTRVVIAYEPVWAIGTGKNATPEDAHLAHSHIRSVVKSMYGPEAAGAMRIIYGGSCNATNSKALFSAPEVDGGLIGGASLKAEDFLKVVAAAM